MKIRVLQNTLINGVWADVGVGDFDPATAQHLIEIGVAEPYETKVKEVPEVKKDQLSSASQPDPASTKVTAKKRRGRPPKSSQSTTPGD